MGCWCRCLSIVCWSILVHINSTHKHTISQKINIKYEVTVWISKTEFPFSYESALVWPCLGITSPERNANRIRSIPTQLPPNSAFSPPHSAAGSHDLSHVPDMICGLGLEADGASVPLCCFRRRVQRVQQFSGFRKSSSRGAFLLNERLTWLHHKGARKSPWIPFKMAGSNVTVYNSWPKFEEGAS